MKSTAILISPKYRKAIDTTIRMEFINQFLVSEPGSFNKTYDTEKIKKFFKEEVPFSPYTLFMETYEDFTIESSAGLILSAWDIVFDKTQPRGFKFKVSF